MRLNRKNIVLVLALSLPLAVAGCGGLQTTRSVSPATFLIPGLMRVEPQPTVPDPTLPARVQPDVVRL